MVLKVNPVNFFHDLFHDIMKQVSIKLQKKPFSLIYFMLKLIRATFFLFA